MEFHQILDNSNQHYSQLNSFAGLSSSPRQRQDSASEEHSESNISSLSSQSQDASPNQSNSQHRKRFSSYESADDGTFDNEPVEDDPINVQECTLERLNTEEEFSLFSRIFCLNSHPGREHTTLKDKVKVASTLSHGSIFKDRTRAVQTIDFHEGAIWTMKFSPTGAHLCTAGQNTQVVIWCVGGLPIEEVIDGEHYQENEKHQSNKGRMEITHFIHPEPYRVLEGHTSDVIDVAWSKLEFLLSASTDKTVRLWHVRTSDCLQFFRHPDIVTAVEFHPLQDRYYISGCFDRKLRVWDIIPDPTVLEWTQTTDTITSVCFSPDGKIVAGGLIQGKVYFYDLIDYDQLKYKTQMECRNRGGKHSAGTKVTGMCFQPLSGNLPGARVSKEREHRSTGRRNSSLMVTTNDSRLRLCNLSEYTVEKKFKGLRNTTMQIRASFSVDGEHVICGSETGSIHIWNVQEAEHHGTSSMIASVMGKRSDRTKECESFEVTPSSDVAATTALFAPVESMGVYLAYRHSEEPVQTKNHPPPSRVSTTGSAESYAGKDSPDPEVLANLAAQARRFDDISNYSTRVIVTGDYDGKIRVFFRLG